MTGFWTGRTPAPARALNGRAMAAAFTVTVGLGVSALAGSAGPAAAQYLPAGDIQNAKAAAQAYATGRYEQGRALLQRIKDPAIRRMVAWYAYTRPGSRARFRDITGFIRQNPEWPWQKQLRRNAELAVRGSTSPADIIAFYAKEPPKYFAGQKLAYDRLMSAGRKAAAVDLIRRSWARSYHNRGQLAEFQARFGGHLRPEDHYAKLDNLLFIGAKRAVRALLRTLKMTPAQNAAIQTRLAMGLGRHYCGSSRRRAAPSYIRARLAQIPYSMKRGEAFTFDRARFFSCAGRIKEAYTAFATQPSNPRFPERWWRERSKLARDAIRIKAYKLAYNIILGHRQAGQKLHAHAEWFAGFIAFRLLKNPARAEQHFRGALASVESAWTRSKILYWHGRLKESLGQKKAAQAFYQRAARYGTTFYGQLAHGQVSGGEPPILRGKQARPTAASFWRDGLVKAMVVSQRLGLWRETWSLARMAMLHRAKTPAQHMYLVATLNRLTSAAKRRQMNVRVIKYAQYRGHPLIGDGYPTIRLPQANTAEPAFIYALIRQESEFNATVGSWAGARGYMQLMPATARREARNLKLRYRTSYLTRRPAYNLRIGTYHVEGLIKNLDGAYPMVLAAYNAGEHRVNQWIAWNGDPRQRGGPDWVTWIELITFDETRDYVKRVLEAHTVYRMLLEDKVDTRKLLSFWKPPEMDKEKACKLVAEARKAAGLDREDSLASSKQPLPAAGGRKTRGKGRAALLSGKVPNADLLIGVKKSEAKDPLALTLRPPKDNIAGAPEC